MGLLLTGGHVLSQGVVAPANVLIEGGVVECVGDTAYRGCEQFDARDYVAIPGLRNTHMHAATSLVQGMPVTGELDGWVKNLWRFEQGLTAQEAYSGALYSCQAMLRSGITYFEDMHFHELEVAAACEQAGIRATLSEALMDVQPWRSPATVGTSLRLARRVADIPLLEAKMGIVSVRMASDELVDRACAAFRDHPRLFSGYHLHIDEVSLDAEFSQRAYGQTPTEYFYKKGVLGPGTTVAHYVHPSPSDLRIMSASGAGVSHCYGSNMRLCSGQAPVAELVRHSIPVSLGIDSPSIHDGYSMWGDARAVALTHGLGAGDALSLLCGSHGISPGMAADIVLLKKGYFFPYRNMAQSLLYGMTPAAVAHVFVGGRQVVSFGEVTTLDTEEVAARALDAASCAWSRLEC